MLVVCILLIFLLFFLSLNSWAQRVNLFVLISRVFAEFNEKTVCVHISENYKSYIVQSARWFMKFSDILFSCSKIRINEFFVDFAVIVIFGCQAVQQSVYG